MFSISPSLNRRAILACVAACTLGFATQSFAADLFARPQTAAQTDDVYFLAQIQVDDMETFQSKYVPGTSALLNNTNALVLAISPAPQVLEGSWESNWTVLMRFDSQADFDSFYQDPAYQNGLVPIRLNASSVNNVVILPAFDPTKMGQ